MQSDIFKAELYTNDLLSDSLKDEVDSTPVSARKASLFLDNAIKPSILINDSRKFYMLLKVMENYEDEAAVRELGKIINSMLRKESSSNETGKK